jgi:hypothetical protein
VSESIDEAYSAQGSGLNGRRPGGPRQTRHHGGLHLASATSRSQSAPADHGIHSLKVVKGTEYTSELCLFNRRSGDLDSKAAGFMRAAADTNMTTIIVRLMMI